MKGLLNKDFMMIKSNGIMIIVIALFFFVISLFSGSSMYFAYYSVSILSVLPVTLIAYDETYKWNRYELLLPVSRAEIVAEKYLLSIILVLPVVIIESIVSIFAFGFSMSDLFSLLSIMLMCGLIIPSVVLPVIFKFGFLKGKIINLIIIAVMAAFINIINKLNMTGNTVIEGRFTPQRDAFLFSVIAVALLAVSLFISINVYKKREL